MWAYSSVHRIGMDRLVGGEGGIRTHGFLAKTPVFKTGAFNRSATSPFSSGSYRSSGALAIIPIFWSPFPFCCDRSVEVSARSLNCSPQFLVALPSRSTRAAAIKSSMITTSDAPGRCSSSPRGPFAPVTAIFSAGLWECAINVIESSTVRILGRHDERLGARFEQRSSTASSTLVSPSHHEIAQTRGGADRSRQIDRSRPPPRPRRAVSPAIQVAECRPKPMTITGLRVDRAWISWPRSPV